MEYYIYVEVKETELSEKDQDIPTDLAVCNNLRHQFGHCVNRNRKPNSSRCPYNNFTNKTKPTISILSCGKVEN